MSPQLLLVSHDNTHKKTWDNIIRN